MGWAGLAAVCCLWALFLNESCRPAGPPGVPALANKLSEDEAICIAAADEEGFISRGTGDLVMRDVRGACPNVPEEKVGAVIDFLSALRGRRQSLMYEHEPSRR